MQKIKREKEKGQEKYKIWNCFIFEILGGDWSIDITAPQQSEIYTKFI